MGQKVNPTGLRLGINRTWDSRWYADDKFADYLLEDVKIKEFLKDKLAQAGISKIVIERPAKKARVTIHSARPGVVIGKKGQDIENLRKEIQKLTDSEVQLNILLCAWGLRVSRLVARGVWAVPKLLVPSIIVKAACLCILYVLTLIMQPQPLIQLMVPAALRFGSIRAKLWLMIRWRRIKSWLNKNNVLVGGGQSEILAF